MHNHEWEEHKKKGWVFCWICGEEKLHDGYPIITGEVLKAAAKAVAKDIRRPKYKKL